jgi:chromosome partitioning protein
MHETEHPETQPEQPAQPSPKADAVPSHEPVPAPDASPAADAPRPHVVALLNQKGGVGKTTSTVNLGAALARFGCRVLLIDLDPQSNLSLHFGVEAQPEQPTVHDLLMDPSVRVEDVLTNARPGLDFIPAVTELALVEGALAHQEGMQTVLRRKLEPVFGSYDVILLDCPPSLGVLSVNALTVADEVFVPMQAHYLPLRGLEKLLQTVHLVSQGLNPLIRVTGILLCMHDPNSGHARAVIGEIEAQLDQYRGTDVPWSAARVMDPPVRRNIKLAEAPSFGMTIFDYAPRCPGAGDYRELARGLLERWGMPCDLFDGVASPRAAEVGGEGATATAKPRRARKARAAKPRAAKAPRGKAAAAPKVKAAKKVKPAKPAKKAKASKPVKAAKSAKPAKPAKPASRSKKPKPGRRAAPARRGPIRSGGLSL